MAKRAWRYFEPVFVADGVCPMHPVWPWGGHRRFGYDLARWMRPGRIAELGVHWGTSFFTFAQAMKDGRMRDTELIGVDTFEGEDHAGHYGPEVLETVRGIVADHFAKQKITLHKKFFREALAEVGDESVDLLHIDGLHTFDAVKEDFETWLPKLAPEGVVLFHDVASDAGYGSADYWRQIVAEHAGFAFEHSWGLGVLFPKGVSRLEQLRASGLEDKLVAYPALARAERAVHEVRDLTEMATRRLETIEEQTRANAALRETTVAREAHDKAVARAEAAEKLAVDRLEIMQKQSETIRQRDERLGALGDRLESANALAVERYEVMQQQSGAIRQRDEQLEKLGQQLESARAMAVERLEALREANTRAGDAARSVLRLEPRAAAAEAARDELRERARVAESQRAALAEEVGALRERAGGAEALVAQLREDAGRAAEARTRIEGLLADMAEHVSALVGAREKDRAAAEVALRGLGEAVARAQRAGESAAAALSGRLDRLGTDAELLAMRAEHLEGVVDGVVAGQREARREGDEGETDWLTGQAQPRTHQRRASKP